MDVVLYVSLRLFDLFVRHETRYMKWRLIIKWISIVFGIFLLGGIGGVFIGRSFLPWLSVQQGLDRVGFLKRAADNVTIINKTEQITVREDDTLGTVVSQPATAVVTLIEKVAAKSPQRSVSQDRSVMIGTLLTNDGVIVTYRETAVPVNESSYIALLFDGSHHEAYFIGWDPLTNLAFFRIDVVDAPSISFANSDDAIVGKKLIALARADQAHQNRFITGVLNVKDFTFNLSGKTVSSSEKWEGVFRADFRSASDFIGGPVIQYNGEMLGIVGSLLLDNVQQTFIVPGKAIQRSLDFILEGAQRPVLGTYYLSLTRTYALQHDLERTEGALIYSPSGRAGLALIAGKAGEKAGLRVNDIVVAVNGEAVTLTSPLSVLLVPFRSGDTITLTIDRGSLVQDIPVLL